MADPHTARWLVLGHYGGHNTGDEAMLSGLVQGCPLELHSRLTLVTRSGSASLPPQSPTDRWTPCATGQRRCSGAGIATGARHHLGWG